MRTLSVAEVGHTWDQANSVGRREATELIEKMRREELPMLLGHWMKKVVESGHFGGVEVGFCHQISVHLMQRP